jgi:cytochrome c5
MEREMTMRSKHLVFAITVLASTYALAQTAPQGHPAPAPANKKPAAAHASQQYEGDGERIFKENCSRCHNAPEGFSPHISGTIVRHMRVRASLSEHDEQELLRFFNP